MLNKLFTRGRAGPQFQARSADRDAATDQARIAAVANAIDEALRAAEAEHAGLSRRMEEVTERAAIATGNDGDEYVTRDAADSATLDRLDRELANGEDRLKNLSVSIGHFKFLKAALLSRFPDFKKTPTP
jgi:uncharacterized protein YggE